MSQRDRNRGALVLVVLLAAPAAAEDWPRWRGPRGDGTWAAPPFPDRWPAGGPRRVWAARVGGGYAGLTVADGRLVTMDYVVTGTERVVCLDAATGKQLWEHKYAVRYGPLGGYANGPRAAPTVHDGHVYTFGAVGHTCCLDAATGKRVWSRDTVKQDKARVPEWGFASSPVVDGDRVIVHPGADGGSFLALDRRTGHDVWRSDVSDPAGYCTPILIDAPAGRQLVGWTPENVHGLDPATGKRLWSVPYPVTYGVAIATPVYRDGVVFVTGYWEGSKAIRLGPKPADAKLLWEDTKTPRGLMSQPLERDGHLYTVDRTRGLVCTELTTGKHLWDDHRLTPKGRNPHATLVWAGDGDRALIVNAAGELIVARLSPRGYHEESRVKVVDGGVWSHPGFAGRRLYVRRDGGEHPEPKDCEIVGIELGP